MSEFLNKLTPVSKGDDVRSVASAERITALQDAVKALWMGENIRDERGMFIQRGVGGVGIRFRRTRGGGGSKGYGSTLTPESISSPVGEEPARVRFYPTQMMAAASVNGSIKMVDVEIPTARVSDGAGGFVTKYGGKDLLLTDIGVDAAFDQWPELDLALGENEIWATWEIDVNATVKSDPLPKIVLVEPTSAEPSIPVSPEYEGNDGFLKQLCGIIWVPDAGTPEEGRTAIEWTPIHPCLSWEVYDREFRHVGEKVEIVKIIEHDHVKFRTLEPSADTEPSGENVKDVHISIEQKTNTAKFTGKVDLTGVTVTGGHPWKATDDGTGNITIAAGKVMFPLNKGGAPNDPLPIVYDYVSFGGGAIGVGANGWVYVKCEVSTGTAFAGQEFLDITRGGVNPPFTSVQLTVKKITALSLVFSTDDPAGFTPPDDHIYIPIAEVSFAAAVASVEDQILTHNPTHDLTTELNFSI